MDNRDHFSHRENSDHGRGTAPVSYGGQAEGKCFREARQSGDADPQLGGMEERRALREFDSQHHGGPGNSRPGESRHERAGRDGRRAERHQFVDE